MLLKYVLVLLPLISTSSSTTLGEEKELVGVGKEGVKKPKLFYVSTLSTTSTVSTLTVCYVTSATLATCTAGKRRKRRMVELDQPEETILPTSLWGKSYCGYFIFKPIHNFSWLLWKYCSDDQLEEEYMREDLTLEGGEEEGEGGAVRKARFLVYWMTTTR